MAKKKKLDPSRIAALNSLALKQYKVSVLTVGLHNFTVMAMSEQDAHDKVMNGEGGRDAGKEGPVPFAVRVHDQSIIEPEGAITLQRMMQEMMGSMQEAAATQAKGQPAGGSLIQVVQG